MRSIGGCAGDSNCHTPLELEFFFMGRGRNGIGSFNAACADGAVLARPEDKAARESYRRPFSKTMSWRISDRTMANRFPSCDQSKSLTTMSLNDVSA